MRHFGAVIADKVSGEVNDLFIHSLDCWAFCEVKFHAFSVSGPRDIELSFSK